MAETVELKFNNSNATPKVCILHVDRGDVESIMAWYGAYYAFDQYSVTLDGQRVTMDRNGEFQGVRLG